MNTPVSATSKIYEVGGVRMPRPFKLRRLGHIGLNMAHLEEGLQFYTEDLGFRVTDVMAAGSAPGLESSLYFTTNSSDHHAVVLADADFAFLDGDAPRAADNTFNQITWQVGSLREVLEAEQFFRRQGVPLRRVGRDMPGSNWAVYFADPDGYAVEIYYGIEQIGWDRHSKPTAMHSLATETTPVLPVRSESQEIDAAIASGVNLAAGVRSNDAYAERRRYDVDGVLLPRPFKVTRLGPVSIFTDQFDEMVAFYQNMLGFRLTEQIEFRERRVAYLRNGPEHHSLVLLDKSLRSEAAFSNTTSCMALGMEVGSYSQLREAITFLEHRGWKLVNIPPELYTGIDYAAHVCGPDGHLIQLYYCMEQIGWDGRPRPVDQRREMVASWPEVIDCTSDSYVDQTFAGPIG